tara:strand:- start:351 stop:674 length:324 start_codon:yes stop_codon:yes gene_type:complete
MKKITIILFSILLSSFAYNDSNFIEFNEDLNCSKLTIKNNGYQSKNVYVYGKKIGYERWLAASFGLGAGKSTSIDTSSSGYGVTWTVYVEGNYGKTQVYGYGCDYTF